VLKDDIDLLLEVFDLPLLESALLGREVAVGLRSVVGREGLRRGVVDRLIVLLPQVARHVGLAVHR
jgi:hypothetical protein